MVKMKKRLERCEICGTQLLHTLNISPRGEYCSVCYRDFSLFRAGFKHALLEYGIYKDGRQTIGCLETPIKDVLADFDEKETAINIIKTTM